MKAIGCASAFLLFAFCLAISLTALLFGTRAAWGAPRVRQPAAQAIAASYGKLPMSFGPNRGQTDPRVRFLSRGQGYSLFLTPTQAVLMLREGDNRSRFANLTNVRTRFIAGRPNKKPISANEAEPAKFSVLRIRLVGANPNPKISGVDPLPGKANYFVGNDPKKWRTNVPNYAKVKYAKVYPGVDLVYYGDQHHLEYDFSLAPGANSQQIAVRFHGAKRLRLDRNGDLVISTSGGELIEHKPLIYQDIDGIRHRIDGGYKLGNDGTVRFELARYDDHRTLTIDPGLVYSTYLGTEDVWAFGIAVDSSGDAYVTGYAESLPTTSGALQSTYTGGVSDAFVSKLNSTGSALLYSTYLGGSNYDVGSGIALDTSGNAYVTGFTRSSDFPTTAGALQTSYGGGYDAFVSKLNSTGSALLYSTYLGGSSDDVGYGIALDSSGNAYVTGYSGSSDFPTSPGAFQTILGGLDNVFVSKLNSTGSALLYSTYLGGSFDEAGYGIALDSSGNAYVTGYTESNNFPTTAGAFQTVNPAGFDGFSSFVTKLNASGTGLMYSTYLGGPLSVDTGLALGAGIAVDSSHNAYVTGVTTSSYFPTTPGALETTYPGGAWKAFVSKLNSTGTALMYSTYLGGSNYDWGGGIVLGSFGNAYITGYTGSNDFPTTVGALQNTLKGSLDAFLTELNGTGSALVYSTYLGGSGEDWADGIGLDPSGSAYVTGITTSTDFPTTAKALQLQNTLNDRVGFVSKVFTGSFAGQPGAPNCLGKSVSALSNQYGNLDAAASALGFPKVSALQNAIRTYCGQ
jgi:Beta-propeller repeat